MTWCIRTDTPVLLASLPCIDTSALIGTIMLQLSLLDGGTGGGDMPYVMYTRVIEHSPPPPRGASQWWIQTSHSKVPNVWVCGGRGQGRQDSLRGRFKRELGWSFVSILLWLSLQCLLTLPPSALQGFSVLPASRHNHPQPAVC